MRKLIFLFLVAAVAISARTQAQTAPVAFVNELHNAAGPEDEWSEIIVLKDDLDLRGYFFGDNNAATNSWQAKLEFADHPLWRHLRAGTYILISHAKTASGQSGFGQDLDASDGFIKVCPFANNTPYFNGGGATTLDLASGGDFVALITPTGQMVQAIGFDPSPGGSVTGSSCYGGGSSWMNTNNAVADKNPCGKFLFIKENLAQDSSVGYVGGSETALVPTPGTIYTGALSVPGQLLELIRTTLGHGNSRQNVDLIRKLRQPLWPNRDSLCTSPVGPITVVGNNVNFNPINYPNAADGTLGYLIVRYSSKPTGAVALPQDGTEYTVGTALGTGTVVGLIPHYVAGQVTNGTFQDVSVGVTYDSYYRIYPARYRNASSSTPDAVDRGIAYNETEFSTAGPGARVTLAGPTALCANDTANFTTSFTGSGIVRYTVSTAGITVQPRADGVRLFANSQLPAGLTQFTLRAFPPNGVSNCLRADSVVIVLSQPRILQYTGPNRLCFGDTAILVLTGPSVSPIAYSFNEAGIQSITRGNKVYVYLAQNVSAASPFSLFATPPATATCVVQGEYPMTALPKPALTILGDTVLIPGQEITLRSEGNVSVSVTPLGLLKQDSATYIAKDNAAGTYTFSTEPKSGTSTACVAIDVVHLVSKPLNIPNIVIKSGKPLNRTFTIEGAGVSRLQIFSRWGNVVLDETNYQGGWAGKSGVYFFTADLTLSGGKSQTAKGWIEVLD